MNHSKQDSQPLYPTISSPTHTDTNLFHQTPPPSSSPPPPTHNITPPPQDVNPFYQTPPPANSQQLPQNPTNIPAPSPSNRTPPPQDVNPYYQAPPPANSQKLPQNPTNIPAPSPSNQTPPPPPEAPSASAADLKSQEHSKHGHHQEHVPSSSSPPPPGDEKAAEQWGTHVMGHPAVPTCHPDNKKAALWGAHAGGSEQAQSFHHPYLQYQPIDKTNNTTPLNSILHVFNSWSNKAESMANNIWHNLKTGTSVPGAAWAKMNLTAKAITGGGFEALYKQSFATHPNEKLNKSFACYLSTSTGPVAGTLYLSNLHAAFCSDRPLSFTAPSGQVTWSYYKIMVPLGNIATANPVVMRENPTEKYIQIVTIDGHDFWFMGFVNYEKASRHLTQGISAFVASGFAVADDKPHNSQA